MNAPQTKVPDSRLHHPHTALNLMTALGAGEQVARPEDAVLTEKHPQVIAVLQLLEGYVRSTLEAGRDAEQEATVTFNLPGGGRLVCDLSYEDPLEGRWYGEIAQRVCRANVTLIEGDISTHFGAKWFIHDKGWADKATGIHRPPFTFTFSELAEDPKGGEWQRLTQDGTPGAPERQWEHRISENPMTGTGLSLDMAASTMRRGVEDKVQAAHADSSKVIHLGNWVTRYSSDPTDGSRPKITPWPEAARWTPPGRGEAEEWTYCDYRLDDRRSFETGADSYITSIEDQEDGTHTVWLCKNTLIRAGVHYEGQRPIAIQALNIDGIETGEGDFKVEWVFSKPE